MDSKTGIGFIQIMPFQCGVSNQYLGVFCKLNTKICPKSLPCRYEIRMIAVQLKFDPIHGLNNNQNVDWDIDVKLTPVRRPYFLV